MTDGAMTVVTVGSKYGDAAKVTVRVFGSVSIIQVPLMLEGGACLLMIIAEESVGSFIQKLRAKSLVSSKLSLSSTSMKLVAPSNEYAPLGTPKRFVVNTAP